MLFELNDNNIYDIDLDYFNLKNDYKKESLNQYNKRNKIELENGFYLGNIFVDLYKPYKNYKPKKINGYSEQQKMLLKIQELDFIINDLNLYLDVYPNDMKVFEIFKKHVIELDYLKKKYAEKYHILELCEDIKDKYTWIDNPWTWDGDMYV